MIEQILSDGLSDRRAPIGDAAADMVLQHILANFRQPGSYSLALQWLYSLFVAYSQADVSTQHEAAASAHVNAPQVGLLCLAHTIVVLSWYLALQINISQEMGRCSAL